MVTIRLRKDKKWRDKFRYRLRREKKSCSNAFPDDGASCPETDTDEVSFADTYSTSASAALIAMFGLRMTIL